MLYCARVSLSTDQNESTEKYGQEEKVEMEEMPGFCKVLLTEVDHCSYDVLLLLLSVQDVKSNFT